MADRGHGTEVQAVAPNGDLAPAEAVKALTELDLRVTRLEDALATMHDTGPLEDRITERVTRRLDHGAAAAPPERGLLIDSRAHLLPQPLNHLEDQSSPPGQPLYGLRHSHIWLLYDIYDEARAIVQMYFDRRYRMTWQARVIPLVLLFAILTSWIWLPGTSILPTILMVIVDKIVDILLAFGAIKILSREAKRYRAARGEIAADLRS
jgi:hypothetical protein